MAKWWYDYPWRMVQTNLSEIDMADIDAEQFVRELLSFDATVVLLNTSGILASYPTDIPFHFQSEYLTGDSLEKIIDRCHAAGIRVIARTDFSKIRVPVYEQHPEWAYRRADGSVVNYNGNIHCCICGDYQQKYSLEIMAETVRKLPVDGMFFNMGAFTRMDYHHKRYEVCHCERCKELFAAFSGGLPLPNTVAGETMDNPAWRMHKLFQREIVAAHDKKVHDFLTGINPELCVAKGLEGVRRMEANTAADRPLPKWQYTASDNTKGVTSSYDYRMISSNTTVDFIDYHARHAAVSPAMQRARMYQSLANGGTVDYYIMGRIDTKRDRSAYESVREAFSFHKRNESVYRRLTSCAKIALLKDPDGCQSEYRGWYRFLAENHYLFDAPMKDRLTKERLSKYEALILPDCRYLSDELAEIVDEFVEQGGKLISVYHSSFWDERYEPRKLPALRCLGVDEVLLSRTDMRGSYFELDAESFPSLPETELISLDGEYVYANYAADAERRCKLIPPQRFGPPEMCYPTVFTGHPGFLTRKYGKGTTLFLPWKPGKFYYGQGYISSLWFAKDLLGTVMGLSRVETDLPEMVEITHQRNANGDELVSLVNNSGHFGLSFFEPIPLRGYSISVACEQIPKRIRALSAGREVPFTAESGRVHIELPDVRMFEALLMEM